MAPQLDDTTARASSAARLRVKNGFPAIARPLRGVDAALSAASAARTRPDRCWLSAAFAVTGEVSMEDAHIIADRLASVCSRSPLKVDGARRESLGRFEGRPAALNEETCKRGFAACPDGLSTSSDHAPTTGNKSEMSSAYATFTATCAAVFGPEGIYKRMFDWRVRNTPPRRRKAGARSSRNERCPRTTAELRPNQRIRTLAFLRSLRRIWRDDRHDLSSTSCHSVAPRECRALAAALHCDTNGPPPPGVKVSRRSFGRDRRYPITNRFRELE